MLPQTRWSLTVALFGGRGISGEGQQIGGRWDDWSQIPPEDSAGSPFRSVLHGERQGGKGLGFEDSEEVEVGASFRWCPSPPALKELTQSWPT